MGGKKSDTGKTQRRIWGGTKMKIRRNRKEDESRGRRCKTRNREGVTFTSDLTVVYSFFFIFYFFKQQIKLLVSPQLSSVKKLTALYSRQIKLMTSWRN